jgi:hypothetical protein
MATAFEADGLGVDGLDGCPQAATKVMATAAAQAVDAADRHHVVVPNVRNRQRRSVLIDGGTGSRRLPSHERARRTITCRRRR